MLEQLSFTDFNVDQFTTSDLFEQIKERKKEVKTDEIDFSISELSNMYLRGALDIHPEFQRLLGGPMLRNQDLLNQFYWGYRYRLFLWQKTKNQLGML